MNLAGAAVLPLQHAQCHKRSNTRELREKLHTDPADVSRQCSKVLDEVSEPESIIYKPLCRRPDCIDKPLT